MTHFVQIIYSLMLPIQLHAMEKAKEPIPLQNKNIGKKENKVLQALQKLNLLPKVLITLTAHYLKKPPTWKVDQALHTEFHQYPLTLAWAPSGEHVAHGGRRGALNIITGNEPKSVVTLSNRDAMSHGINCIAWSPKNPSLFATASNNHTVQIWDITKPPSSACIHTLVGHDYMVSHLAWSPCGNELVSTALNIKRWDIISKKCTATVHFGEQNHGIIWTGDGIFAATSCVQTGVPKGKHNGNFNVYNVCTQKLMNSFIGHTDWITYVTWPPNRQLIASSSTDGTIRIWQANSGKCTYILHRNSVEVYNVAWSPCSTLIAAGNTTNRQVNRVLNIWDTITGKYVEHIDIDHQNLPSQKRVTAVAWSPCGEKIFAGNRGGTCCLLTASESSEYDIIQKK
jgi:WD40 repeat protein